MGIAKSNSRKKFRIVRKMNRPLGQYACPYERGFVGFVTKRKLRDHIADAHAERVATDAATRTIAFEAGKSARERVDALIARLGRAATLNSESAE